MNNDSHPAKAGLRSSQAWESKDTPIEEGKKNQIVSNTKAKTNEKKKEREKRERERERERERDLCFWVAAHHLNASRFVQLAGGGVKSSREECPEHRNDRPTPGEALRSRSLWTTCHANDRDELIHGR